MSQYDFGTIDPFVVDGTTLAGMLNNWRDALYSLHRSSRRPDYAVPGMLWISDVGGPTNWVVNMYLGPSIGDRAILQVNTTTGAIAHVADQLTAALISASAAANPAIQLTATGNTANAKTWRAVVAASGVLQLQAMNDAGVALSTITFNRDGTMRVVAPASTDNSDAVPTTAWVKANASGGAVATPTYDTTNSQTAGGGFFAGGDAVMQITHGLPVMSRSFTAVDASHPIEVDCTAYAGGTSLASACTLGLFIDGAAAAVAQAAVSVPINSIQPMCLYWQGVLAAGAHTFAVRFVGSASAGVYLLGTDGGRIGGGAMRNSLVVREVGVGPQGPAGPQGLPGASTNFLQRKRVTTGAATIASAVIPMDDTIPQITEGTEVMTLAVTPMNAASFLDVTAVVNGGVGSTGAAILAALFRDAIPDAFAVGTSGQSGQIAGQMIVRGRVASGSTAPTTLRVRASASSGSFVLNGNAASGLRQFGGVWLSGITVDEVMA